MNTRQMMDKQIMDLSSSSSPPSSVLNNNSTLSHDDEDHQQNRSEEIFPSYDFHPIRPQTTLGLSHSALDLAGSTTSPAPTARVSSNEGFGSLDSTGPTKLVPHKGQDVSDTTILSQIDRTMKKHADTLLHVMEDVSARLTQLETRTHSLEDLVDDLKVSVGNSHGSTHGKMRLLENILVEVQSGVQLLKDKHEIVEAQLNLSKLQVSKVDQHPKTHSVKVDPTAQSPTPVTPQQIPQFPLTSFPQPPSSAAALSQQILQPPSSHQSLPPPSSQLLAQLPTQFSLQQQEQYCPPPSHSQPPPPNQLPYQAPPQTQPPHQPPYQPPPQQPQYPQQPSPPSGYIPEEHPSYSVQSYSPNPPRQQPPAGSAPSQQIYNAPQPQPQPQPSMYDGAGGRSNSNFPSGYPSESYPYTGSPMASAQLPHMSGSGNGYPQLSNSRPLPHALPMAAAVSSGSGPPGSESRVPIDDVIDRVTTMGFPRDQVRAAVRKLTENGQAVDLNVVLDKLMNEGGGAWFGGR